MATENSGCAQEASVRQDEPHDPLRGRIPTYRQIVHSSGAIGAATVANIGLGILRTKAIAVILGPTGVGLMSLYYSIADLAQSVAGMGINSSGVRQIAEATGSGDANRVARTATVLKWLAPVLGILGAFLMVAFSRQASMLTFGNDRHTGAVILLSLAVCFTVVAGGQAALIQGMRRVGDYAAMNVLSGLGGTLVGIPLIYYFHEDGVVPALIATAAAGLLLACFYSRRIPLSRAALQWAEIKAELLGLMKLGVVFMASAFLALGTAYAVRIMILHKLNLQAAGLYQSAWAIGGLYVGIILQAMGTDFYPRLTAISNDHAECNRLVNEQAHVSLLLAGPGVIGTLTFAPLAIALCYSSRFGLAVETLRWICLGMTLRIIAWPMGFILLAKGASRLFFWTDVAAASVHMGLAWLLIARFGLNGAGAAFFGLYVWHALLVYAIVRRLTGFSWSAENLKLAGAFIPLVAVVFLQFHWLPLPLATGIGSVAFIITALYSARTVFDLVTPKQSETSYAIAPEQ